jgi:hypothetical protein
MRSDWCKGRVVLSVNTTTEEVAYVVRLEVPTPEGARTVKAPASELTIFPDY